MLISRMDKHEFNKLRDLPDKCVNGDISFSRMKGYGNAYGFDEVEVLNSADVPLFLNGHINQDSETVVFNFCVKGVGAICRYCVNGQNHRKVGRTHKHSVRDVKDARKGLPFAIKRKDLDGLTPSQIWVKICLEAHITHVGTFFEEMSQ